MITDNNKRDCYYKMLLEKNSQYEGTFFACVKTTGVFCRPTCPARKPLKENCEFSNTAQEALLAGYRPCKRCNPLSVPTGLSSDVKKLVEAIEKDPQKKWMDKDFEVLAIHPNTARRQFKKNFNMTFIEYARSRRLGLSFKSIRAGKPITQVQLESGFNSGNGFREAYSKLMGELPSNNTNVNILYSYWLETKLGSMIVISDYEKLYLLEFVDRRGLENEIITLKKRLNITIIPQKTKVMEQLEIELEEYFNGTRMKFDVPIYMLGSEFQKKVWRKLIEIPAGKTIAYQELAYLIGNQKASRAVANANGKNRISILVPCHRIINSDGSIGGYGGGVERKKWLLDHEKNFYITPN